MVSEKATLVNPQGLHMRPAGLFASTMGKYACDVTVVTPEKEVNGKSDGTHGCWYPLRYRGRGQVRRR